MSTPYEGFSPQQHAFAESVEAAVAPDQASIALAMHQRMQPVAERVEDTLLADLTRKQAEGTLRPRDTAIHHVLVTEGSSLDQAPEDVLAAPAAYVHRAAHFMNSVITFVPETTADMFAGYTPIETEDRWCKSFYDAGLTDKWESMVIAALRLEEEGQPRPASIEELDQAANERELYRF